MKSDIVQKGLIRNLVANLPETSISTYQLGICSSKVFIYIYMFSHAQILNLSVQWADETIGGQQWEVLCYGFSAVKFLFLFFFYWYLEFSAILWRLITLHDKWSFKVLSITDKLTIWWLEQVSEEKASTVSDHWCSR